jgi:hypothetical protein
MLERILLRIQRCIRAILLSNFVGISTKEVTRAFRYVTSYSKAFLPFFDRVLVMADSDAIKKAMQSNCRVRVFRNRHWLPFWQTKFIGFEPVTNISPAHAASLKNKNHGVGIILYPGFCVAAEAYAPLARSVADLGYHAAVTVPPLELSLTDVDLADHVVQHWGDQVHTWIIGGHSMGGVIAAAYARDQFQNHNKTTKIKGLILFASYLSSVFGFSADDLQRDGQVLATASCYGTLDGLATPEKIKQNQQQLPSSTLYIRIDGGNHSQFYYGTKLQKHDNPAAITREKQQEIAKQALLDFLHQISS